VARGQGQAGYASRVAGTELREASRRELRIGSLALGGGPRVAVPFADAAPRAVLASLRRGGLDVAELRIDLWKARAPADVLARLEGFAGLPTLATLRSAAEGGEWHGSEAERLALFRALLPRVDAIDVEIASAIAGEVIGAARAEGRLSIASFHAFRETPDGAALEAAVARGRALGADVVKIATAVTGPADVHALARLLLAPRDVGLVVVGMGEAGIVTRVLFPALGSLLTYASAGTSTAPGQIPLDEMQGLLRRLYPGSRGAPPPGS
jgi:3-dehydroquinate dehydratase-1